MIFVTVGTQLPFERLIKAMDAWAARNPMEQVFAQVGHSAYRPRNMEWTEFMPPDMFRAKCEAADLMVSHAGIGNILLAIELQKSIILIPRLAQLKEHVDDHQMATVRRFKEKAGIVVVDDASELDEAIRRMRGSHARPSGPTEASTTLLETIRNFIGEES